MVKCCVVQFAQFLLYWAVFISSRRTQQHAVSGCALCRVRGKTFNPPSEKSSPVICEAHFEKDCFISYMRDMGFKVKEGNETQRRPYKSFNPNGGATG